MLPLADWQRTRRCSTRVSLNIHGALFEKESRDKEAA